MFYRQMCWYKQNNILSQGVLCFQLPELLWENVQISDAMSTVLHSGNLEEKFEDINESVDRKF